MAEGDTLQQYSLPAWIQRNAEAKLAELLNGISSTVPLGAALASIKLALIKASTKGTALILPKTVGLDQLSGIDPRLGQDIQDVLDLLVAVSSPSPFTIFTIAGIASRRSGVAHSATELLNELLNEIESILSNQPGVITWTVNGLSVTVAPSIYGRDP